MAIANFNGCLAFVLQWEGGYVDNPADAGGPTNQGITQATYDAYRSSLGQATQSVQNITDAEVGNIYQQRFWQPSYAYLMSYPLSLVMFDTFVQFSPKTFLQFVATAVGAQLTSSLATILPQIRSSEPISTATSIINQRIAYRHKRVAENPSQAQFLQGWLNRDNALLTAVGATNG